MFYYGERGPVVVSEPGYAKGRAKRREIIERAMMIFGEVGYRGASLRELAGRCGLSHPGLLHYFATKEALLQAVLEQRDHEDEAWLTAGRATGLESLRRLVELVALNATRRPIVELFTVLSAEATASDHPAHDYFVHRYRGSVAAIRRAYAEAGDSGALREGIDPEVAARQLIALMDGLQLQWLLDDLRSPRDDEATSMAAIVRTHIEAQLTVPLLMSQPAGASVSPLPAPTTPRRNHR